MKNIILTSIFALFSFGVVVYGQNPCGDGTIIINGQDIDAVFIENNNAKGLNLPLWLDHGATVQAGNRVHLISVIEFNVEQQQGGSGNSLVFNRVFTIGNTQQTVPLNKVWKIEAITKFANPFSNGITPSNTSPACDGDNVTLNATTVSGATYAWTGPNGFTSSNQNPIISGATLVANGTYFVTASLNGCTYTDSTTVVVDTLPNSNFTNTYLTAGYNGTFSPAVSGLSYSWVFNSGTPSSSSVQNPQVQWASAGSYNVTLTATDGNGCSASTTNPITVNNCQTNQSQSDFSWSSASAGYATTFTPDDMSALTYTWTFDQGTSSMTTSQTPNDVVWTNPGTYNVTLVTTFAGGSCYTTTQQVTVSACTSGTQTFSANGSGVKNGSIQTFPIPSCVTQVTIEAWGAEGGSHNNGTVGGRGAYIVGTFNVVGGSVLNIVVGKKGENGTGTSSAGGGGGGGSFVWLASQTSQPMIVAGGGGGGWNANYGHGLAGTSGGNPPNGGGSGGVGGNGGSGGSTCAGGGGGGWLSNGTYTNCVGQEQNPVYGQGFPNFTGGGKGHSYGGEGGYGGGGGTVHGGGGGGGYSGGGGGSNSSSSGGGGGSFNDGTNTTNTAGVRTGDGQVIIHW